MTATTPVTSANGNGGVRRRPLPAARVVATAALPLVVGGRQVPATVMAFSGLVETGDHVVLALGDHAGAAARGEALVRVHSECLTGDAFGSQRCDCGPQLQEALHSVADAGGYVIYLRQEGRGIGLVDKIKAYALQESGLDTFAANVTLGRGEDERDYAVAAQVLLALGVTRVDLLTGNLDKVRQLRQYGVDVRRVLPTAVYRTSANARYLTAKMERARQLAE